MLFAVLGQGKRFGDLEPTFVISPPDVLEDVLF
jgi:hypothetical protein